MNTPTPDTMTAIERELAAAREEITLLKTNLKIQTNHTENAVQDRADEHIELHNQIQELTEQRDRLAVILQSVINEDGTPRSIDRADAALQSLTPNEKP